MPRQPPLQYQIKQHHCLAPCEASTEEATTEEATTEEATTEEETLEEASRWFESIGNRTEAMSLALGAQTSLQS